MLLLAQSGADPIGSPAVNMAVFGAFIALTLIVVFQSSSALAGAYGIAISSTMLIDSILVIMLLRVRPQEPRRRLVMGVLGFIALIELAFFLSNSLKFAHGGWLPIAVAVLAYVLMTTWQEGRRTLNWLVAKEQMPVRDFLALIEREPPVRVAGTAVYLASEAGGMPRALLNNLRFNRVLQ